MDCNKCKHLNVTEEEQTERKEDHICLKYNKRVLHRAFSTKAATPKLFPCSCCADDYHKHYEKR